MSRHLIAYGLRFCAVLAVLALLAGGSTAGAQDEDEKAQIDIINNRNEKISMRFEYAFRQYTWTLIEHPIEAQDDVIYRYPSNIPGCEHLREWGIVDGILTISNARGPLCQKRVSLCDKHLTTMTVNNATCDWTVRQN